MRLGQRELLEHRGAAVGERLLVRQRAGQPRRREHPPEPQRRREPLRDRADLHDPLGRDALERADRVAVVAELGVVVVLDDQRVLVLGPLEQRRAPLGATARRRSGTGGPGSRRRPRSPSRAARRRPDRARRRGSGTGSSPGGLGDQTVLCPARLLDRDPLDSRASAATGTATANPCANPPQMIVCSGSGAAPRTRAEVVHQRVAELGRAARVAVSERVEAAPRARRSAATAATPRAGTRSRSGTPGSKS